MTTSAEVVLWGRRIGVVSFSDGQPCARFEYDALFREAGVEVSPLVMPLGARIYSFPELRDETFRGLPGLLSDSLPDKFGSAVLDAWLATQGRVLGSLNPVERLCYLGSRGMGAIEYRPVLCVEAGVAEVVQVDALAQLASEVLGVRNSERAVLAPGMKEYGSILKVGASAGGARAKAIIGWNESTGEVRSGQVKLPDGFGYWLMKFDGVSGNGDKDGDDPKGYGRIEYAYSLMATAAGIEMSECRLWGGRHFMTRRFDRTATGGKFHMQTLGALAHMDFNLPGSCSYEQAFRVTREVVGDVRAEEELFRRMVFNVLAWNCDDHVKNVSFLMGRDGVWHLAPAYDLTFSYDERSRWVSCHQMTIAGKRNGITIDDIVSASRVAGLKPGRALEIVEEVRAAVGRWPEFAERVQVDDLQKNLIGDRLNNKL